MYNQITSNKEKTILLFTVAFAVVAGLGYLLSVVYNNPFIFTIAIIIAIIQAWVSYFYSDKIALGLSGAREANHDSDRDLYHLVENLTMSVGLPMPGLYVIDDPAINAFATGRDPKHAAVAVTRGAIEKLDKSELEGVLAHELSHVQNRDILIMTVVVTLVGILSLVSDLFLRWSFWGGGRSRDDEGGGNAVMAVFGIIAIILAPIIGTLIQLAISRKREYLADASGALITRYPDGLASALEKIGEDKNQLRTASTATAHLFIANPFKKAGSWASGLLQTHPPLADRIKRLHNMAS